MRIDNDHIMNFNYSGFGDDHDYIEEKYFIFNPDNALKYFGWDFYTKVGRLHNHEKITETHLSKVSDFKDEATCGRCGNCNGFPCGVFIIPKDEFTVVEDESGSLNIFYP